MNQNIIKMQFFKIQLLLFWVDKLRFIHVLKLEFNVCNISEGILFSLFFQSCPKSEFIETH